LGTDFDIAAFHDVILGHAAVPLWTLERLVDDWIADRRLASPGVRASVTPAR
jgi:hypothetical protein